MIKEQLLDIAARYCRNSPVEKGKFLIGRYISRHIDKDVSRKLIWTRSGFRLELTLSQFIQREIYIRGEWEPHTCEAITRYLRPDNTFLDIGANIGFISLFASKIVGPKGRVFAIEANPSTFAALQKNIDLNECINVVALDYAIGDGDKEVVFYLDEANNDGNCGVVKTPKSGNRIKVAMTTVDKLIETGTISRPALIKMDIEGAEVAALEGMTGLLSSNIRPTIICEVSEWSLEQFGSSKDELFRIMSDYGYHAEVISPVTRSSYAKDKVCFQYDVVFT